LSWGNWEENRASLNHLGTHITRRNGNGEGEKMGDSKHSGNMGGKKLAGRTDPKKRRFPG